MAKLKRFKFVSLLINQIDKKNYVLNMKPSDNWTRNYSSSETQGYPRMTNAIPLDTQSSKEEVKRTKARSAPNES